MKLREYVVSRGSTDLDSIVGRWFVIHPILIDQIKSYLTEHDDRRVVYDWLVSEYKFDLPPMDLDRWLDKLMGQTRND